MLVGLQGSGKSTFARSRFGATHVTISKDLMPRRAGKEALQQRLLAEALSAGRSAVLDNTSPRPEDRAPAIALAKQHGARVVGYFFPPDVHLARERNARREGRARVPDVAIFTTAKRMREPTYEEGFDELHRVEVAGTAQAPEFEVTAIR